MLFITEKDKRLIRRDSKLIIKKVVDEGKELVEAGQLMFDMILRRLEISKDANLSNSELEELKNFALSIQQEAVNWYLRVKSKAAIAQEFRKWIQEGKSPRVKNGKKFVDGLDVVASESDYILVNIIPDEYKEEIAKWYERVLNKILNNHFLFRYFKLRLEYKKYCAAIIREASKHMINLTGIYFEDLSDGLPAVGSLSRMEWENFKENVRSALHAAADEIGLASNWRKDLIERYMKVLERVKERYVRASQENESFLGSLAKMAAGLFLEHNLRKF